MISTLQEFFRMGGYAFYVWSAYGLACLVLGWHAVVPGLRERRLLRAIGRRGQPGDTP
jgi:heme exporter protein D